MTTTTQRYASRDKRTGRLSHCGEITTSDGGWHLGMTHREGHDAPVPVGRRLPPVDHGAPRRWRPER